MRKEYNFNKPEFQINDIGMVEVIRDKNFKYSFANGRNNYGLIYVQQGRMLYSFTEGEEKRIFLDTDELLFIPKGSKYYATYLEDRTQLKIIQFDISSGNFSEFISSHEKIRLPNAKAIVDNFFYARSNRFTNRLFHYISLLYDMFWQIDIQRTALPKKYSRLQPALDSISLHPEENKKISYYAEICNMCETNFRKLFHEYSGKSPIEYRNSLRLEKAKAKLQSGEYNVSEVAESCGFTNLSFFIRLYKSKYGYTPKKEY